MPDLFEVLLVQVSEWLTCPKHARQNITVCGDGNPFFERMAGWDIGEIQAVIWGPLARNIDRYFSLTGDGPCLLEHLIEFDPAVMKLSIFETDLREGHRFSKLDLRSPPINEAPNSIRCCQKVLPDERHDDPKAGLVLGPREMIHRHRNIVPQPIESSTPANAFVGLRVGPIDGDREAPKTRLDTRLQMFLSQQETVRDEFKPRDLAEAGPSKVSAEITGHEGFGQARKSGVLGEGEHLFTDSIEKAWTHRVHFEFGDSWIRKGAGQTPEIALVVGVKKNLELGVDITAHHDLRLNIRHQAGRFA
jgi:hypothetical protein